MRLFESILDDLEATSSGTAADTVRRQKKDDDVEYDVSVVIRMDHVIEDEEKCAAALCRMADNLSELLESSVEIDEHSNIDIYSSWPDLNIFILRNHHSLLYKRPSNKNYTAWLQVKFSYSFRRPIYSLYFLARMYNALNVSNDWTNISFDLKDKKQEKHVSNAILQFLSSNRHNKEWSSPSYDTERTLISITNFMVPCINAYIDVSKKFDTLNFNDVSFATEAFNTAAYNLNKKIVIPGYLYAQMENAKLSGAALLDSGKFDYYYYNVENPPKVIGSGKISKEESPETWIKTTFFDELDRRSRKPWMIYAHVYKNIFLNLFITLGPFYEKETEMTFLFAVNYGIYILDEELIAEGAENICNNLFGSQVNTDDFIKFIKETFAENYAK